MSRVNPVPHYTLEDYNAIDRGVHGERFEFVAGEIIAMVGGTRAHNLIVSNIQAVISQAVLGRPCDLYREGFRLRVADGRDEAKFYPDLFMNCDPLPPEATEATDATLIVEVLSPSTADYDRDTKLNWYCKLPSLREYIIVETQRQMVSVHRPKVDEAVENYTDPADAIALTSIEQTLRLHDIYAGVHKFDLD